MKPLLCLEFNKLNKQYVQDIFYLKNSTFLKFR